MSISDPMAVIRVGLRHRKRLPETCRRLTWAGVSLGNCKPHIRPVPGVGIGAVSDGRGLHYVGFHG
jgi:hypothetical protein